MKIYFVYCLFYVTLFYTCSVFLVLALHSQFRLRPRRLFLILMIIPRKFLFQNDKIIFIRFSAPITRIILRKRKLFALTSNSQHTLELRWFYLIIFHDDEDKIIPFFCFITISFVDVPSRLSSQVLDGAGRAQCPRLFTFRQGTGFAFRLVLSQSTVHVLTRVTDGDHHHSTEVVIIGGATWKLNRPVNSRWDYRIQIPLSNI